MSQVSSNIKIDSPAPALASQDVQRYYDFLQPAFHRSGYEYEPEHFDEDLLSGNVLLVRIWNGDVMLGLAAVRTREVKGVRDLFVLALVGEEAELWAERFSEVCDKLAGETECGSISMVARPGLKKYVQWQGYKVQQIIYRKDLKRSNGDGR